MGGGWGWEELGLGGLHDLTATMRIYLEAVIGPRTELEDAGLLVEWEVLHVDLAR